MSGYLQILCFTLSILYENIRNKNILKIRRKNIKTIIDFRTFFANYI